MEDITERRLAQVGTRCGAARPESSAPFPGCVPKWLKHNVMQPSDTHFDLLWDT
jgi:hypothetical protein